MLKNTVKIAFAFDIQNVINNVSLFAILEHHSEVNIVDLVYKPTFLYLFPKQQIQAYLGSINEI